MYNLYPDGIITANDTGHFPIHYAAIGFCGIWNLSGGLAGVSDSRSDRQEIIEFVLSKDPDGASRITTNHHRYPLHFASMVDYRKEPNVEVLQVLYDANPEAIVKEDTEGHTPHDLARGVNLRYGDPPHTRPKTTGASSFLEVQLAYYHKAQNNELLSTYDDDGRLPLHRASQDKAPLGSVKLLVNGNETALQVIDKGGMLPLHIACEYGRVNVVKYLVELFDGHLSLCDKKKNYPLHHACRGGNLEVIKYLLGKQSSADVSERNGDDKLPVQLLLECNNVDRESLGYTETIWQLLLAYPAAVVV